MGNSSRYFTARTSAARTSAMAFVALIAVGLPGTLPAAADTVIGARVTTQGLGIELSKAFANTFAIRGGLNFFPTLSTTPSKVGIDYDATLKFRSGNLFVDVYPASGPFRLTAGLVIDKSKIDAVAISAPTITIGGQPFTQAEYGILSATIRNRTVNPYLGIGIGNPYAGLKWGVTFEVGAYLYNPRVAFTSTGGTLSDNPLLLAELEAERAELQDKLGKLPVWPVIGLTLTHRF